jgi:hypothetical protein
MLLANLLVGFHEQVRLQPEIVEALNAPLENVEQVKRNCLAVLLPDIWIHAAPRHGPAETRTPTRSGSIDLHARRTGWSGK